MYMRMFVCGKIEWRLWKWETTIEWYIERQTNFICWTMQSRMTTIRCVQTGIRQYLFGIFSLFLQLQYWQYDKIYGFFLRFNGFWFTLKYFNPLNDNLNCGKCTVLVQPSEIHAAFYQHACKRSKFKCAMKINAKMTEREWENGVGKSVEKKSP